MKSSVCSTLVTWIGRERIVQATCSNKLTLALKISLTPPSLLPSLSAQSVCNIFLNRLAPAPRSSTFFSWLPTFYSLLTFLQLAVYYTAIWQANSCILQVYQQARKCSFSAFESLPASRNARSHLQCLGCLQLRFLQESSLRYCKYLGGGLALSLKGQRDIYEYTSNGTLLGSPSRCIDFSNSDFIVA